MNQELVQKITEYVEDHIGEFHNDRIEKIKSLDLKELLKRKNPYMYKAKNIVKADDMIESIASAFMASADETFFGNWMEGLAIYVSEIVYGGHKSSARGIDLEFDKNGVHYFVSVKSGPYWSNSSSLNKLKQDFVNAVRIFNTSRTPVPTKCIEGCCYGNDNKSYTDSTHEKYCGEKFWYLISGEPNMFVDIIEPLGYRAKEKNDVYEQEFASMKNKCVREFTNEYCDEDGRINWEKLVRYNAALKAAK